MNPELETDLDTAVKEVLGLLTGLDLTYVPEYDRYYAITRQINRAMRSCALEKEWSWFADTQSVGTAVAGNTVVNLPSSLRPRIVNDDAVRLVDDDGNVQVWAYFLPRDAGHKYQSRTGLWVTSTRQSLLFSRGFYNSEDGLDIQVPIMREPVMFRLPEQPEDPETPLVEVPLETRQSLIDFPYPDLIILRAAHYVAQSDPLYQPRVQTIEAQYKDLMYQIMERDDRHTDSPYQNEWNLPMEGSLRGPSYVNHRHPHADERR